MHPCLQEVVNSDANAASTTVSFTGSNQVPKLQATFTPCCLRSSHLPTPVIISKFLSSISLGRSVRTQTFTRWSVIVPLTIVAFLSITPYQGITSEAVVSYPFTMLYLVAFFSRSFYVKAMFWSSQKRAAVYKKK